MSKPIRFVYASDSHGDMADPEALEALWTFCKEYKPDVRIAGGDHFDFRALRRGVGQGDAESGESLKADLEAGKDFLRRFLRPGGVYLWGNHEHRLDNLISSSSSAMVRDYCQDIKDDINRTARQAGAKTILPYHADRGVYRLGPVAFIHGYAHGVNATTVQGLHYAEHGGALIHGHTHNLASIALTQHGSGNAFSAGCLCLKEEMGYASARLATSRWGSGFVAGWVDGRDYKAHLIHKVGRRWVWSADLTFFTPTNRKSRAV
jgi:hypothetical protein